MKHNLRPAVCPFLLPVAPENESAKDRKYYATVKLRIFCFLGQIAHDAKLPNGVSLGYIKSAIRVSAENGFAASYAALCMDAAMTLLDYNDFGADDLAVRYSRRLLRL